MLKQSTTENIKVKLNGFFKANRKKTFQSKMDIGETVLWQDLIKIDTLKLEKIFK